MKNISKVLAMAITVILVVSSLSVSVFAAPQMTTYETTYSRDFTEEGLEKATLTSEGWTCVANNYNWNTYGGVSTSGITMDWYDVTYNKDLGTEFKVSGQFSFGNDVDGGKTVSLFDSSNTAVVTMQYKDWQTGLTTPVSDTKSTTVANSVITFTFIVDGNNVKVESFVDKNSGSGDYTYTKEITLDDGVVPSKISFKGLNCKILNLNVSKPVEAEANPNVVYSVEDFSALESFDATMWEQSTKTEASLPSVIVSEKGLSLKEGNSNHGMKFAQNLGNNFTIEYHSVSNGNYGIKDKYYISDKIYVKVDGMNDTITSGLYCGSELIKTLGYAGWLDYHGNDLIIKVTDGKTVNISMNKTGATMIKSGPIDISAYDTTDMGTFQLDSQTTTALKSISFSKPGEMFTASGSYDSATSKYSGTITADVANLLNMTYIVAIYNGTEFLGAQVVPYTGALSTNFEVTNTTSVTPTSAKVFFLDGFTNFAPYQKTVDLTIAPSA